MSIRTPAHASRKARATFRNFFRRFVVLGAGLLILTLPSVAFADQHEDDDPFDRPGFYIGVGGSYQKNFFESDLEDQLADAIEGGQVSNVGLDLDDSGGINAVVGYRAASFVAFEIKYEWVSKYDVDASATIDVPPATNVSGGLYSIEGHTLTGNMKLIVPTWRIQPYFLVGGGFALSDVDRGSAYDNPVFAAFLEGNGVSIDEGKTWNPAARVGLGIDWYITENIVVNTEAGAVVTTLSKPDIDDIEDLNYMSFQASLQYRF